MNTQLLVEALGREGQFHMAPPAAKENEILAVIKRERVHIALISARQGTDTRAGFTLSREIRSVRRARASSCCWIRPIAHR